MTERRTLRRSRSPFSRLRAEHRRALEQLRSFEHTLDDVVPGGPVTRGAGAGRTSSDERPFHAIANYLSGPFRAHLGVEERVVFPLLGESLPELAHALEPLREEHTAIRELSESLRDLLAKPLAPRRAEQLPVLGRDLTDLIRLHVRKEERTVLDWSERVLPASVLAQLEHRIAQALASDESRNRERP